MDYVQDAGPSECFVESGKAASEVARNVIPNRDSPRHAYIIKWKNLNDQGDWAPFDCNTPVLAVSTPSHPDQSYEILCAKVDWQNPRGLQWYAILRRIPFWTRLHADGNL